MSYHRQTWFTIVLIFATYGCLGMENGLARTPPMGWLAWERFRCNIDCKKDPNNCISEKLFMQMADEMVEQGFDKLGYEYINVDDCYFARSRDSNGHLIPDPDRFPSGMKALGDYIHSKGLKFGVYEDIGTETCGGYPGMEGHFQDDINTFVSWGIDMLKLDGCYADVSTMNETYPQVSKLLGASGRPIVFSCSWPAYTSENLIQYNLMARYCNLWRNWDDIDDNWASVASIIEYWGKSNPEFYGVARPGAWNDPDMLIIGNFGLNVEQSKVQFALWAIVAAPLLMSNDLRNLSDPYRNILMNNEVIAVNQDPLGRQGFRIFNTNGLQVWKRDLIGGDVAVVLYNSNPSSSSASSISFSFSSVGLTGITVVIRDLFLHQNLGTYSHSFSATVNPESCVMLRLIPTA